MPDFIWSFHSLRVQASHGDMDDVVVGVSYRLCCTDSYRAAYRYGELTFAPPDPAIFTPFREISKQDMTAFAGQTLGPELATIQQELLAELAAPPIDIRPMPWEEQDPSP